MRKIFTLPVLFSLPSIILNTATAADTIVTDSITADSTTTESIGTPPVIVTASRFETSIDTAPVNVTIITGKEIARSGAITLADVLNQQAGVSVSNLFDVSSAGSKVDLGGFGENGVHNTLVLINGRRLNDMDNDGPNMASIPLEGIAQIEIVHGSSSVLYGDNAVSGVINIVTKDGHNHEQGSIKVQTGSFQTQRLVYNQQKRYGNTALSITLDNQQSNGYRDENSSSSSNFTSEISKQSSNWIFGTRFSASKEVSELPGALDEPDFKANPKLSIRDKNDSEEERYVIEGFIENDHLAAELAIRNKHQEFVFEPDSFGGIYSGEADLRTLSFTPRANRRYGAHKLIAGLDYYKSNFDSSSMYNTSNLGERDIKQDSYGIYLSDAISVGDRTTLNIGLRQHVLDVKANDIGDNLENKRHDSINSWDATLNHKHNYGATNYVRLATSFRAPTLDEMWNYSTGEFTLIKPQKGRHLEIGTRQTIASDIRLKATLFRMDLEDEIAFDISAGGGFGANTNLDKTRHDGLNFDIQAPVSENMDIRAGYAYRKATFQSGTNDGNDVPLIPNNKLTLAGNYQFSNTQNLTLTAIYTGDRYFGNDDTNSGKKMSAYTRIDLNYSHRFSDWKGNLQIKNVGDVKTADIGFYRPANLSPYSYYPLSERAIYLSLEGSM